MGKISNLFSNEDLDIKDVLDQYENMQLNDHKQEPGIAADGTERTKPIRIDLEDTNEDTPNSYIQNNKTIVLNKEDEERIKEKTQPLPPNHSDDDSYISFTMPNVETNKSTRAFKTVKIDDQNPTTPIISAQPVQPTPEVSKPQVPETPKPHIQQTVKPQVPKSEEINLELADVNLDKETRILFNESQVVDKKDLTREINDAENIIIEDKNSKDAKKELRRLAKLDRKQQKETIKNKLPQFVRFELFNNKFKLYLSGLALLACAGGLGYVAYAAVNAILSFYLFIPFGLITLIILCIFVATLLNTLSLKKELKLLNYEVDNEKPLSTIKKIYRHLITANINLNWICASLYVLSGFAVLITYIVTYFINLTTHGINEFGLLLIANTDATPAVCMWTFTGVCGFLLIFQILYNFVNRKRKNDIEIFYKDDVYPDDLQLKMRKTANIRGGIIFAISTILVGFIAAITYLILKRRPAKVIHV